MAEVLFYHLTRQPLEKALPVLVERALGRGWRVLIRAASTERVAALDEALWTYDEASFLPHGTDKEPDPESQPVLITAGEGVSNGPAVIFLLEGLPLPDDLPPERAVVMFDGADEMALAAARRNWRLARERGLAATYWQQDERGAWIKKA